VLHEQLARPLGVHPARRAPPLAHEHDVEDGLTLRQGNSSHIQAGLDLLEPLRGLGAAQPYPYPVVPRVGVGHIVGPPPAGPVVAHDAPARWTSSHRPVSPLNIARRTSIPASVNSTISAPCGSRTPCTLYSRMSRSGLGASPKPMNGGSSITHPWTARMVSSSTPP